MYEEPNLLVYKWRQGVAWQVTQEAEVHKKEDARWFVRAPHLESSQWEDPECLAGG